MSFYNTGNPVPSIDPRDLDDNAKHLDVAIHSAEDTWIDRLGATRKSIKGVENGLAVMQEGFDEAQAERANEFDTDQAERVTEFNNAQSGRELQFDQFITSSGYEPPVDYTAGILLERTTQTVSYLGNEYRAKNAFLPFTTSAWATDEAKLKLIGDDSLRQNLADVTDPLKNAGMVGFDPDLPYPANTIGSSICLIDARALGILADGSDETAKLAALAIRLKDTGVTLQISSGILQLSASVTIEGFRIHFAEGASIRAYGTSQAAFNNGAIRVKAGAVVSGGTGFTSGAMVAAFGSTFATRPAVIYVDGGELHDMDVYSQIYAAVKYSSGEVKCKVTGGVYSGFLAELTQDIPYNMSVDGYNIGVAYVDKLPSSFTIADCRAVYVKATVVITNKISLAVNLDFCTKNGVWVQGNGGVADNQLQQLFISGDVTRAGYYKDAANATQLGHGAGTCLEILNAPNVQSSMNTSGPQGYNVAIASASDDAQMSGLHRGNGGDPVVVVANSQRVIVGGILDKGTVGASVGEDGATSNDCIVTATIRNMSSAPVQFGSGRGLNILGAKIYGEPTLASAVGSWSGPGEVRPVVRVTAEGNDVVIANCTVQGWFTDLVVDRATGGNRLRVTDKDNTLICPILARNDIQRHTWHRKESSADFLRVLNDSDATGHAGVGEISLPAGGATFLASAINPMLADLTTLAVAAGETLADIMNKYAVQVYMKYVPGALSQQVKFGLASSSTFSHVGATFFGTFGDPVTPAANSIQGVLHKLIDGEWINLTMTLDQVLYDSANPAALTHFIVYKSTNPTTYDLTITKPTLVYIGAPPKSP